MNTLTASDLRKEYNGRLVVGGVTLSVNAGEVVGLLGPNGAGKTTSFYMIVGLIKPDSGSVFLDFKDVTGLAVYERARAGIGYLPQEASVFRNLTVRENINLVWEETGQRRYMNELTDELLREFKITHIADTKGYSLSGGERRRVEIARALTLKPKFILLDEPFSGIDPIAVADIQSMIQDLKAQGYGVLITDHNVRETLSITDRAYLIHDGAIFLSGTPDEIVSNELARKFYLGENFEWEGHKETGRSEELGGRSEEANNENHEEEEK
ncbi:MAG: LPS export ABC transporter ATP-binding protein [Synergistales bacterium]|nr:LPS export ABC transporter ATP-binding protein [Synergistales bacterium]MDY6401742.1 LPS export ABC transporter ATP-binding protein [Synergistales bacterium]MDY6404550.1 LPS export ABC transporter ATP-binding protein [Synergistales bacterium]MDY6411177.1 LPS export ABC transporter ATP-binding protein [Synergistales bacterium]MDY6413625.1 LPS export ABC transporter ATP-binding protein [Synergistales bacterium]